VKENAALHGVSEYAGERLPVFHKLCAYQICQRSREHRFTVVLRKLCCQTSAFPPEQNNYSKCPCTYVPLSSEILLPRHGKRRISKIDLQSRSSRCDELIRKCTKKVLTNMELLRRRRSIKYNSRRIADQGTMKLVLDLRFYFALHCLFCI
jgi:hypothetical protein